MLVDAQGEPGSTVNNMGPLQLDLLAPFVRVHPAGGTAVGVAVVNALSVIASAVAGWRSARLAGGLAALASAAMVMWAMGSALLIDARQHQALMLVFLAICWSAWGLSGGDRWCLPVLVFAASLALQTHLTYVFLVVPIVLVAPVLAVVAVGRRGWVRPGLTALGVGIACWIQPVLDQLFGTGNLGLLLRSRTRGARPGGGLAATMVAEIVTDPTQWFRAGFREYVPAGPDAPSAGVSVVLLVAVAIAIAGAGALAAPRLGRVALLRAALGVAVLLAAVVNASRIPFTAMGVAGFNNRWLWPLTAFLVASTVLAMWSRFGSQAPLRVVAGVALVGLAVAAVASVPSSDQYPPTRDGDAQPIAREIIREMEEVDWPDVVLVDRRGVRFGEAYSYIVLVQLHRMGVAFRFDDPADLARYGSGRSDLTGVEATLEIVTAGAAGEPRPGARRIAHGGTGRLEVALFLRPGP